MNPAKITEQLDKIRTRDDFADCTNELTEKWSSDSKSLDAIEPILRFMEIHPEVDYGMPGPLVHFVERFYGHGYEQKLIESIDRRPTAHTVWMLNRVINGTQSLRERQNLISVLERARKNVSVDAATRDLATGFLERHSG